MALNNAGLNVSGANNPNWKGGLVEKKCGVCRRSYQVKRTHAKSRFCSLQCVGVSQRGRTLKAADELKRTTKQCEVCGSPYSVPTAHASRHHCCSRACSYKRRSVITKGENNPSWSGGMSRFPYPWNFREISQHVIKRDGAVCQNPGCNGADTRLTTRHINYEKQDCRPQNLICLCSACNSKANFGREKWRAFYIAIMASKKDGGGWVQEDFG